MSLFFTNEIVLYNKYVMIQILIGDKIVINKSTENLQLLLFVVFQMTTRSLLPDVQMVVENDAKTFFHQLSRKKVPDFSSAQNRKGFGT